MTTPMLKIVSAKVDWYEEYDNYPSLRVLFNTEPDYKLFRYEQRGPMYFAQQGPLVSYYYYVKPDEGFGGHAFHITMIDGTPRVLRGPWSSNSVAMTSVGFPPSKECAWTGDKETFKRGYTFYSGAILLEAFRKAIEDFCPEAELCKCVTNKPFSAECSSEQNSIIGSVVSDKEEDLIADYIIVRRGMTIKQSQGFKRAKRMIACIEKYKYNYALSYEDRKAGLTPDQAYKKWSDDYLNHIEKLLIETDLDKLGMNIKNIDTFNPRMLY